MTVKPPGNVPRWIEVSANGVVIAAIAFVANPQSRNYAGRLSLDETADMIASACGHWGSCAEYLLQTVTALAAHGIHDPYLHDLDIAVAARLARFPPLEPG
jgi:cation transport protein ChaC